MSRKAVFFLVNFRATACSLLSDPERDCVVLQDMYLEDFTSLARGHLKILLDEEQLALFTVFDPSNQRLPWHVPLHLNDADRTSGAINLERCVFVADSMTPKVPELRESKALREALLSRVGTPRLAETPKEERLDPRPFVSALREAVNSKAAHLGEFQVPSGGRISSFEANAVRQKLAQFRHKPHSSSHLGFVSSD